MTEGGGDAHVELRVDGGVATLFVQRPRRLNEAAFEVFEGVRDIAVALRVDPSVRVVVLTGLGAGFGADGDIELALARLMAMRPGDVYEFARVTGEAVRALRELPQPVIASIDGVAAGAGAVLALAADMRILSDRAGFQFLFARAGIASGDMGVYWLLPRVAGFGRATELLMMGDRIEADGALEHGLANRVVPHERLDAEVERYVARLEAAAPGSLAVTKDLLNRAAAMDYSTAIDMTAWSGTLALSAGDLSQFQAGFMGMRRPG